MKAPFTQHLQGESVAPLLHLATLCKSYEGKMGMRYCSAPEPAVEVVTERNQHLWEIEPASQQDGGVMY